MYQARILIAEDDRAHREILAEYLSHEGFHLLHVTDGLSALRTLREGVDLAILDLHLPALDGLNVLRRSRRDGVQTPVIVLTGRTEEVDRVVSFEAGADDYVPKPYFPREVVCRVKSILGRCMGKMEQPETGDILRFTRITIDDAAHEVCIDGEPVSLRPREYALLIALARNPNITFSRERLMQKAWGDDYYGDERAVDGHIRRIRAVLADRPDPVNCIATVYGYGYKFVPA